jgi:hypothetical protein
LNTFFSKKLKKEKEVPMNNLLQKLTILFLLGMIQSHVIKAQTKEDTLRDFNQTRIQYNKQGMVILGSWAVSNIIWGGTMASRTTGEIQGFHQMNAYWNAVNLLIAGFGYYSAVKEVPSEDFWQTIKSQHSLEKILLVNAG